MKKIRTILLLGLSVAIFLSAAVIPAAASERGQKHEFCNLNPIWAGWKMRPVSCLRMMLLCKKLFRAVVSCLACLQAV